MIAFGGKREKGARNEKKESKPLLSLEDEDGAVRDECEDRRETNVRNAAATKNETAMKARGSRMMGIWSRKSVRGLSALRPLADNDSHPISPNVGRRRR
jgi:hypothetical protein